jgi:hypothetical protein
VLPGQGCRTSQRAAVGCKDSDGIVVSRGAEETRRTASFGATSSANNITKRSPVIEPRDLAVRTQQLTPLITNARIFLFLSYVI